jgi:hypothetical protein
MGDLLGGEFIDEAMDQNGIRLGRGTEFTNIPFAHMPSRKSLSYSIPVNQEKIKRKLPIFINLLKISIDKAGESWYTEATIPTAGGLSAGGKSLRKGDTNHG